MSKVKEVHSQIKGKAFALEGELSFPEVMKSTFKEREFTKKEKEELFELINKDFLKEVGLTKTKFSSL